MAMTSLQLWLRAIQLSSLTTALLAAFVGLVHLWLGGTADEPKAHVTVCGFIVDNARQTAIAMVRSSDRALPFGQRRYLVDLDLSSPTARLTLPSHVLEPFCLAPGPDGQLLVAAMDGAAMEGVVYCINPTTPSDNPVVVTRHKEAPFQIVCSPDGRWLVTVESEQLCVWDFQSGALQWRLDGSVVHSVALVPHIDAIVCGMADGSVVELSLETGDELQRISRHQCPVMTVTVSPQRDRVASYCAEDIRVTDRLTGALLWQHCSGKNGLPLIKFSHDGRRLVTAEVVERRWAAHVWDLEDPKRSSELGGHVGALVAAEFLANDKLLTCSANGTLCRWSLTDCSLLEVICPAWPGGLDTVSGTMSAGRRDPN